MLFMLGAAAAAPTKNTPSIGQRAIYGPDSREEHAVQTQEWKDIGDATAMILMPGCDSLSSVFGPADNNNEHELQAPAQPRTGE